jgi:hypothetical protein
VIANNEYMDETSVSDESKLFLENTIAKLLSENIKNDFEEDIREAFGYAALNNNIEALYIIYDKARYTIKLVTYFYQKIFNKRLKPPY